jgi:hypothetical protein
MLVWKASTRVMNPSIPESVIAEAYERDPASAAAEFGADFRTDVGSFIDVEVIDACTISGRYELPPDSFYQPTKSASISTLVRRVLHDAGIRGYSVHGLRKNAAQALAEAGCSISEIMAITGHRSPGMALHYAKHAEKKRLARSGMKRWEDSEEPGTEAASPNGEVSNLRTKRG